MDPARTAIARLRDGPVAPRAIRSGASLQEWNDGITMNRKGFRNPIAPANMGTQGAERNPRRRREPKNTPPGQSTGLLYRPRFRSGPARIRTSPSRSHGETRRKAPETAERQCSALYRPSRKAPRRMRALRRDGTSGQGPSPPNLGGKRDSALQPYLSKKVPLADQTPHASSTIE